MILTTKGGEQVRILLRQLWSSENFCNAQFDRSSSTYFKRYFDISIILMPSKVGDANDELAESMMSDGTGEGAEGGGLREEDVDAEMFIFPERDRDEVAREEEEAR